MKIDIWHNIIWARYKGVVFSEAARIADEEDLQIRFFQIAKTDKQRETLSEFDPQYHKYPYELIFDCSYDSVSKRKLHWELARRVWRSPAQLIVLAGYDKTEYWVQLLVGLVRSKRIGVFCDSTQRDRPRGSVRSFLKRFFFHRCNVIFCYGERARQYVRSFGVLDDKIVQRVQAAALPFDYSADAAMSQRASDATLAAHPRFLYVGRLSTEKNIDVLLKAFDRIWQQFNQAELVIIGTGPQRAALEFLAQTLASRGRITFAGARSGAALYREYSNAACLVLPSESEPWGLVVNEALSFGCPVLVSDRCGCVPELVIEGRTGLIVRCGDIDDLAAKMLAILEPAYRTATFAKGCIMHISSYSPAAAAQQLLNGCVAAILRPNS